MALVTELVSRITANLTNTVGLSPVQAPLAVEDHFQLANGTGSGQADRVYSVTNTLGASATANLDLAGSLTDAFGTALTIVKRAMSGVVGARSSGIGNGAMAYLFAPAPH